MGRPSPGLSVAVHSEWGDKPTRDWKCSLMSIDDLTQMAGERPLVLLAIFVGLPLLTFALGNAHGRGQGERRPWGTCYAVLIYLTVIPGTLSGVLTGYTMFFIRGSLLQVNLLVYLLPIVSMVVTLFLMRGRIDFKAVPGFDRLSGLVVMIAVSFFFALLIHKTAVRLFFFGSLKAFFAMAIGFFALLKWGAYMTFRRPDEPKLPPPPFPQP